MKLLLCLLLFSQSSLTTAPNRVALIMPSNVSASVIGAPSRAVKNWFIVERARDTRKIEATILLLIENEDTISSKEIVVFQSSSEDDDALAFEAHNPNAMYYLVVIKMKTQTENWFIEETDPKKSLMLSNQKN